MHQVSTEAVKPTHQKKKSIIIGVGINITPARLALINFDVNDGDYVILVGSNSDALNALVEFTRFTKTLMSELSPLCLTKD